MKLFHIEESSEFEKGLRHMIGNPQNTAFNETTQTYVDYELTQTMDEQSCIGEHAKILEEKKLEKLAEEARIAEEERVAEEKKLAEKAKSTR